MPICSYFLSGDFKTCLYNIVLFLKAPLCLFSSDAVRLCHEDVLFFSWALVFSIFLRFRRIYSVQGVFGLLVPIFPALAALTSSKSLLCYSHTEPTETCISEFALGDPVSYAEGRKKSEAPTVVF